MLSGAYAVLEGAVAIVTAVDRYALADSGRPAVFVTPEVRRAIGEDRAPYVDASELRAGDQKLGLGSSAAIVVASVAAWLLDQRPEIGDAELGRRAWPIAERAHREAQGGGSGIDVITCALGSTRLCWRDSEGLHAKEHMLPEGTCAEVYASGSAASTPEMISRVRSLSKSNPPEYREHIGRLIEASRAASNARDLAGLLQALRAQAVVLAALGDACGAPIVPHPIRELTTQAHADGVVVMPSGAGGGDIVVAVGSAQRCALWRKNMENSGLERMDIRIGARGVHRAQDGAAS